MKICIIRHGGFPSDPRVKKEAFALAEARHSVFVFCLKSFPKEPTQETIHGIQVYRISLAHKRKGFLRYISQYILSFVLFTIKITLMHFKEKFDFIQVHTMPDFLVFSTMIPKMLGAKIVLDLHEPMEELWVTKNGDKFPLIRKLIAGLEVKCIRYSDRTLTVTSAMKTRLVRKGINDSHVVIIPNVADSRFLQFEKTDYTRKETFSIVTHGLIEERYGHDLVIRAINDLKSSHPQIRYNIIGKGEHRDNLEKMVSAYGLNGIVTFHGFLEFDKMIEIIINSDVGIIAMKGNPYAVLIDTNKMYEYISMKVPVIASRLPAVEEVFDDSCILYFSPGDHIDLKKVIVRAIDNQSAMKERALSAFERNRSMTWEIAKKTYLGVFESFQKQKGD